MYIILPTNSKPYCTHGRTELRLISSISTFSVTSFRLSEEVLVGVFESRRGHNAVSASNTEDGFKILISAISSLKYSEILTYYLRFCLDIPEINYLKTANHFTV